MARKPNSNASHRHSKAATPRHNTVLRPKKETWVKGDQTVTQTKLSGGIYRRDIQQGGKETRQYGFYDGEEFKSHGSIDSARSAQHKMFGGKTTSKRTASASKVGSSKTVVKSTKPSGGSSTMTLTTDKMGVTTTTTEVKSSRGKQVAAKALSEPIIRHMPAETPSRVVAGMDADAKESVLKTAVDNARRIMNDPTASPRQRESARQRLHVAGRNLYVHQKTTKYKERSAARKIALREYDKYEVPPKYAKPGTKWNPNAGLQLREGQYVSSSGFVRSTSIQRVYEMQYNKMHPRPKAKTDSALREAERKSMGVPTMAERKLARDSAKAVKRHARSQKISARKRQEYLRRRTKTLAARKAAISHALQRSRAALEVKPQLVKDYLRSGQFTRMESRAIRTQLPHDLRYPPMRHASGRPFKSPPKFAGPIHAEQWRGLHGVAPISSALPGRMFTTPHVLYHPDKFIDPRGVVFNVDISEVQELYMQKFPAAIRGAMREMRPIIAKRMLDIIEPYVPKDTGRMYTSAEDLTAEASEGGVLEMSSSGVIGDEIMGATIAYRAPYAEIVYFDLGGHKAHGAEYNAKHGTSEKGDKETARWIEVAFEQERSQIDDVMKEMAGYFRASMNKYAREHGYKRFRVITPKTGVNVGTTQIFMARR